ncbi:MAG: hypothetical protein ACE5D2_08535 [Fidelibacterota bacterium]
MVLFLITTLFSCNNNPDTDDLDPEPFRELARNADCADIVNRLFLIDGKMVFWNKEGNCADAAYTRTLFGKTTDEVLCYIRDSIAGIQTACQASSQEMFNTIISNLNQAELGLGKNHQVEEIPFLEK